jgi:polyvinyl alcohol dehydrogenase (cytochrome)
MRIVRHLAVLAGVIGLSISAFPQEGGAPPPEGRASEGSGYRLFLYKCGTCHGKLPEAPTPGAMKQLSPERIYEMITTGTMRSQAEGLTDEQKIAIAEGVSGRKLGMTESGDASKMSNVCASHPPVRDLSAASWNGWSPDPLKNTRYQPASAAKISPAAVARLQLKWAFGLPAASSAYGQPTVVDGRVFIGSDSGYLYSLDAASGCVHWSFLAQAGLRSTPMVAPVKPGSSQLALFFGDIRGNVYSVDASNGELLWKMSIDPHPLSRITAGVKVHDGRVYVSVASLDAATGKQIWKTYTITEEPSRRTNSKGVSFLGPSGAGVWGPVAIDPKRRAVYVSTGNAFSEPDVGRSDAVIAMDMDTGKILWVQQPLHGDVWNNGNCPAGPPPPGFPPRAASRPPSAAAGPPRQRPAPASRPPLPAHYYCPDQKQNPDWDFSAGVMLVDLPGGKSLVVAGQKSGMVWAYDPDKKGELVWKADISRGQIIFGGATDGEVAYFGMRGGALAAVRLKDGLEQWAEWVDPQPSMEDHRGVSAAVSLIPGVVFVAGLDGTLRAFSAFNGKQIWQYDTTQKVQTVNGVEAKGGSIGSAGPVVVNGMVYVTSGYIGFQGGEPGNLLLAFGPPED